MLLDILNKDPEFIKQHTRQDRLIIKSTLAFLIVSCILWVLYMLYILSPNLAVSLLTIAGVTISTIAYDRFKIQESNDLNPLELPESRQ